MKGLIVADSSPLITLLNIGRFALLEKLFTHLVVPNKVAEEVERGEAPDSIWFTLQTSGFIRPAPLQTDPRLALLLLQIDPGESEAILLADQLKLPLLIDEKAGRKVATLMGLKITGLVGILGALQQKGEIPAEQLPEILQDLERVEFRLSADLKRRLLEQKTN
jgi:predicted nucleic acid-binding protein